ncbi:MAG: hypothetical protein QM754_17470 [Tepidisphaeraceae bacterium]
MQSPLIINLIDWATIFNIPPAMMIRLRLIDIIAIVAAIVTLGSST